MSDFINGDDWEVAEDTPPESKFIGWPAKPPSPPQPLAVEILEENEGATSAADEPCPEYEVQLLQDWTNHRDGQPEPVAAGSVKVLTCGQAILKDRIEQLKPQVGDQLLIVFDKMAGRAKHFQVSIKRKARLTYADLGIGDKS